MMDMTAMEEKTEKKERDERAIAYLQHCVSENLNHARHVENERLTFTSIYIAMVIGAVAVVFGLEKNWVAFIVSLVLTIFGLMSMLLNMRWQGVFDDHINMAEQCQQQWLEMLAHPEVQRPLPLGYYYRGYSKTEGVKQGLRRLCGESVNDAKKNQDGRPVKRYPETCSQTGKGEQQKKQGKVAAFFKEMARTRRMFAILYLLIFLALLGLTLYLGWQALQSPTGTGFYFSSQAITDLENVFNRIVEEAKK